MSSPTIYMNWVQWGRCGYNRSHMPLTLVSWLISKGFGSLTIHVDLSSRLIKAQKTWLQAKLIQSIAHLVMDRFFMYIVVVICTPVFSLGVQCVYVVLEIDTGCSGENVCDYYQTFKIFNVYICSLFNVRKVYLKR